MRKTNWLIIFLLVVVAFKKAIAQPYTIDISHPGDPIASGHLKLGSNHNPQGEILDANSLYFIRDGKPWYPVMGEFHFSRFPREQWEESILKMKMAGITVIATYVFWIYHEEEEGVWNWAGNRDLKAFVQLCKKHDMYVFARIGPWCHGEVRNGGFPDWLLQKNVKTRTNDSLYLHYAGILYDKTAAQLKGLYFKDGGPVIGAQIENEFRFNNPKGLAHMNTLLQMAKKAGIDVPYYTATGWPGSNIHQNELIPVWGGYPEAPWDKRTTQLPLSQNYLFDTLRSDPNIGNDLNGNITDTNHYSGYRYPYATAEMGGGIQITYHRRHIIQPQDVTGLAYAKIGSGANLMGYYMFHGGHNSIGKFSTLQESKATGYPNDYPVLNYDFQSPIGEWGDLHPSYQNFKALHLFLNDFGEKLAVCNTYFPAQKPAGPSDTSTLRWSVRSKDGSGFIFINHFQRKIKMQDQQGVQFQLRLPGGKQMRVPEKPMDLPAGLQTVWPVNLQMGDVLLKYATAQPLCILHNGDTATYVFYANEISRTEYVFARKNKLTITGRSAFMIATTDSTYRATMTRPGPGCMIQLHSEQNKTIEILTLTREQALQAWKVKWQGRERLILSPNEVIVSDDHIRLQSTGSSFFRMDAYPAAIAFKKKDSIQVSEVLNGVFTRYFRKLPEVSYKVNWKEAAGIAGTLPGAVLLKDKKDSTQFSMPFYTTKLQSVPDAKYYSVSLPSSIYKSKNISNVFFTIDYTGDTQAAYLNGQLVADHFFCGEPMTIALKPFASQLPSGKMVLLITPRSPDRKVFFEKDNLQAESEKAAIRKVMLVPQYELNLY